MCVHACTLIYNTDGNTPKAKFATKDDSYNIIQQSQYDGVLIKPSDINGRSSVFSSSTIFRTNLIGIKL